MMTIINYISLDIMDYGDIESLFTDHQELKKFTHKRWVKIHLQNTNYDENTSIRYNCRNIDDKLVSYHEFTTATFF